MMCFKISGVLTATSNQSVANYIEYVLLKHIEDLENDKAKDK